ncbi:MAG: Nramp family divalent metal transporter [Planctomycetaceae bacterium]|nr:Nramp family divalent metal transporter [Planctomycetaceae bacterium]
MHPSESDRSPAHSRTLLSRIAIFGPGLLVAATGVGAGDLATGAFTGDKLGTTILWAVLVGAFFKYVLNEGLTRWQLATGETLLEGCLRHFGTLFEVLFLGYLMVWSFLVALALMSACGATCHAILPWNTASQDKVFYGIAQSLIAVVLVRRGGFQLFEKLMSVTIGLMFLTVISTVVALQPDYSSLATGLFVPRFSPLMENSGEGLMWTVGLLGGVGGTLTIVCYAYWIRELGREGLDQLPLCRVDLGTGYAVTALFGIGMVVIGEHAGPFSAKGSALLVELSQTLGETLGPTARWVFLIGAWGAVFSSLLGVWQSVPYLFADFWQLRQQPRDASLSRLEVDCESREYRVFLYALATVPSLGMLVLDFKKTQLIYAIVGALSIPLIACVLVILCGRSKYIGANARNHWATNLLLVLILLFFAAIGGWNVWQKIQ